MTVKIVDESYKNICCQAFDFSFSNLSDSMEIMHEDVPLPGEKWILNTPEVSVKNKRFYENVVITAVH